MPLIESSAAPSFEMPGLRFTGLAAPSRGASENAVWMLTVEPGVERVPHHMTREETLVAVEGRARAFVGGREHHVAAGSALVVPAHTEFALDNPFDTPFRAVVVLPVGGQAQIGDAPVFRPPWAE